MFFKIDPSDGVPVYGRFGSGIDRKRISDDPACDMVFRLASLRRMAWAAGFIGNRFSSKDKRMLIYLLMVTLIGFASPSSLSQGDDEKLNAILKGHEQLLRKAANVELKGHSNFGRTPGEKTRTEVRYLRSGGNVKLVETSGERTVVMVATPEICFTASRQVKDGKFSFESVCFDDSDGFERQSKRIRGKTRPLRNSFSVGPPALKEMVEKGEEVTWKKQMIKGRESVVLGFTAAPVRASDGLIHDEITVVFDAKTSLTIRVSFHRSWVERSGDVSDTIQENTFEDIDTAVFPNRYVSETRDENGKVYQELEFLQDSVVYGKVSASEFTLKGCGLEDVILPKRDR